MSCFWDLIKQAQAVAHENVKQAAVYGVGMFLYIMSENIYGNHNKIVILLFLSPSWMSNALAVFLLLSMRPQKKLSIYWGRSLNSFQPAIKLIFKKTFSVIKRKYPKNTRWDLRVR